MDRGGAFFQPSEEQQYIDSRVLSTSTSFTKSLNDIANHTKQVFLITPSKTAGTTMRNFARKCSSVAVGGNVINKKNMDGALTRGYEFPTITSSFFQSDRAFIDLVKGSTRETLIIQTHREELSRVRSAIQMVLMSHICPNNGRGRKLKKQYNVTVEVNNNRCTIDEEHLIRIIRGKDYEIGYGAPKLLTCDYFDAIAQNTPSNLVFVHYKQADKVQKILAKYHCPHIMKGLPIASNVAANKKMEPFVRLRTDQTRVVPFNEWFDQKQNVILWALDLKREMSCQSKTMDMEDHLFSCPDEAVTLIHGEFQCVSLS